MSLGKRIDNIERLQQRFTTLCPGMADLTNEERHRCKMQFIAWGHLASTLIRIMGRSRLTLCTLLQVKWAVKLRIMTTSFPFLSNEAILIFLVLDHYLNGALYSPNLGDPPSPHTHTHTFPSLFRPHLLACSSFSTRIPFYICLTFHFTSLLIWHPLVSFSTLALTTPLSIKSSPFLST